MALDVPAAAIQAMEQTNSGEWIVTAFYGADQTIPSDVYPGLDRVPLTPNGSLTFDADGEIQGNGSVYLALDGESLVPKAKTDPLAPYGQELAIVRRVNFGDQSWDIPLGRYRIGDVPDTKTYYQRFPSAVLGWSAQLNIVDLFDILDADDFLALTTPKPGNTTWQEIQALSPLPIVISLPDKPIPAGVVYRSRSDAIAQLMSNLGGEPHLTRQGALTARVKNNWLTATEPVAVVNGVVSVSEGMSNQLKNSVSVTNPNDASILSVREITDEWDPLRVSGPLRRRTEQLSDPLMDTQAKADAAAVTALARLSSVQSRIVKVSCTPRPDLELGDYIQVNDQNSETQWFGEMRHAEFSWNPTDLMSFELTVAEKR